MDIKTIRELFPCPDCGVDANEPCLSRKGNPMHRFTHPNRSLATKTTLDEVIKLRDWLRANIGIFEE